MLEGPCCFIMATVMNNQVGIRLRSQAKVLTQFLLHLSFKINKTKIIQTAYKLTKAHPQRPTTSRDPGLPPITQHSRHRHHSGAALCPLQDLRDLERACVSTKEKTQTISSHKVPIHFLKAPLLSVRKHQSKVSQRGYKGQRLRTIGKILRKYMNTCIFVNDNQK